jgi:hypothetical protein
MTRCPALGDLAEFNRAAKRPLGVPIAADYPGSTSGGSEWMHPCEPYIPRSCGTARRRTWLVALEAGSEVLLATPRRGRFGPVLPSSPARQSPRTIIYPEQKVDSWTASCPSDGAFRQQHYQTRSISAADYCGCETLPKALRRPDDTRSTPPENCPLLSTTKLAACHPPFSGPRVSEGPFIWWPLKKRRGAWADPRKSRNGLRLLQTPGKEDTHRSAKLGWVLKVSPIWLGWIGAAVRPCVWERAGRPRI